MTHREALCTSQAAKKVPALQDYQETLTSLFLYTKHSPNKRSKLKDFQKVLDDPQLKYKEVYEVRWLSFFTALETVFETIDSLLCYLNQVKSNDPKGTGLRTKIATEKFLYITHMMMDIMPPLMKLQLWFQKDNLDVALIHINVDHCINELLTLQNEQGEHMKLLKNDLYDEMGKRFFKGHEITKCGQQLVSVKKTFIEQFISNMRERFPETELLSSFCVLSMRPISLLSSDDLKTWGNEKLLVLTEHYGETQSHTYINEDKEKISYFPTNDK